MRGGAVIDNALKGLTDAQRQAVVHMDGPLLVLAGPGSGKTRVITRRIAHLIGSGIPPWQILALTFTNKAAAEMRERVDTFFGIDKSAVGPDGRPIRPRQTRGLTITTFHSLCARLIRRHADEAKAQLGGLTPTFSIFDTSDQMSLVKKAIEQVNVSTSNFPPRGVLSRISAAKNELVDAEAFERDAADFSAKMVAKIFKAYQKLLRAANAADFDDLLVLTARVLRENEGVRNACRERWQYLLVDEYQDTNKAQFVIASMLAGAGTVPATGPRNFCVVGDPDQSIYGWRGADLSNILQFEKVFSGAKVVPLGENFRSTKRIISSADALIRNNTQRKHKDLFTSNAQGEKIEIVACRDEHHEAAVVVDYLRARKEGSGTGTAAEACDSWSQMAVFYRTNALSRVMEDALRNSGIPYVIARGTAFYEREEVKNALAYLRVVANPNDDVSLERIVNTPSRGIGDTTLEKVQQWAATVGASGEGPMPLFQALREAPRQITPPLPARTLNAIGKFVTMIDTWRGEEAGGGDLADSGASDGADLFAGTLAGTSLGDLVDRVIRESGLEAMYKAGKTEEDEQRLDNLAEVVSSAREFEENYQAESDPAMELGGKAERDEATERRSEGEDQATKPRSHEGEEEDRNLISLLQGTNQGAPTPFPLPLGGGSQAGSVSLRDAETSGDADEDDPLYVEALDTPSVNDLLRGYLERVTLVSDSDAIDPSLGAVTLMTLHAAKGLEFPVVAMIGLEEGCLPHARGLESPSELEEERRLCFVGITRAMRRLLMTSSRYRTVRGVPERTISSRFLEELPAEHVLKSDQAGWQEPGWDEDGGENVQWGKSSYQAGGQAG